MNNGFHTHEQSPFYVQALQEHAHLHAVVEKIHQKLDQKSISEANLTDISAVTQQIAELRDQLQRHFSQEEEGGYLEEAITRVPQLAHQASLLQRQHGEFLALSNRMLDDARCGAPPADIWIKLQADYSLFSKRLSAHEAAENAVLQQAFNEDLGIEE